MKINAPTPAAAAGSPQGAAPAANADYDFRSVFEAAIAPKTPQEELAEYLKKTPIEHMIDAVLKRHGLTKEKLAALPPEERKAMEEMIAKEVREALQKTAGNAQNSGDALLAMVAFASDAQKTALAQGREASNPLTQP